LVVDFFALFVAIPDLPFLSDSFQDSPVTDDRLLRRNQPVVLPMKAGGELVLFANDARDSIGITLVVSWS
jgi:hypothetical protein